MSSLIERKYREILHIVAIYSLFGALWIYFSDSFLGLIINDSSIFTRLSIYKGLMFITFTALLLFFLILRYVNRIEKFVAQQKLADDEISESRALYDDLVSSQQFGIYRVKSNGRGEFADEDNPLFLYDFISDRYCELIGVSRQELLENPVATLKRIHSEDYDDFVAKSVQANVDHCMFMWEGRIVLDGQVRWVHFESKPRDLADGYTLWTGVLFDITQRKTAELERFNIERQLLHSQKLESLGVLAGGIAHDFNNILSAILGNLEMALMKLSSPVLVSGFIEQSILACRRASDLTHQMLAYSGKGLFIKKNLNLSEIVKANVALFRTVIQRNVDFKVELSDELPAVLADPGQVQQVVMNLITNAAEAIGDQHGVVTLSTGVMECDADFVAGLQQDIQAVPGRYVYLLVSDDGCGMSPETQKRLFEPFFTTKFTGRGLGMAATQGIIRAHNAFLQLESSQGNGSTFRIFFPVAEGDALPDTKMAAVDRQPAGSLPSKENGVVLVVEADAAIRDLEVKSLEMLGFKSVSTGDGQEAVQLFRQHRADIIFVLLDLTTPVMDVSIFDELKRIRADVRVIISSAYGEQIVSARFKTDRPDGYIQKPFQVAELAQAIRAILSATNQIQ